MSCPLCDEASAVVETDPIELRVTCEPCGPTFRMTHAVLEEWRKLSASAQGIVLVLAREHLKIMRVFMPEPRIQEEDIWAWARRSTITRPR